MKRRLILLALVALGLSPGTWLRSPRSPKDYSQSLSITALPGAHGRVGAMELLGAWQLQGRNWRFGGYSALLASKGGRLLAGSDRGDVLYFSAPGSPAAPPQFARFGGTPDGAKRLSDLESLTSDPASGAIWAAYEGSNSIERLNAGAHDAKRIAPAAMRDWGGNAGPEALARLHDGRFIVLREGTDGWFSDKHRALLFPSDPVDGATPVRFTFLAPRDYDPTDMAELPDGRVLILLRKLDWGLPPGFSSAIMLADPRGIAPGKEWSGKVLTWLKAPAPPENYEGMAIVPQADGTVRLWLVSDDNSNRFQRSLLLHLSWDPRSVPRSPGPRAGK